MFEPLNHPESVVDRCTDAIRHAILDGSLPVGSKLPSERSLAEQFDVHRGTVRAALDRLSEDGLLDVRQGRGYQVKDYRLNSGPDLLGSLAQIASEEGSLLSLITDLLLVRRQLAVAVLERIEERHDKLSAQDWAELRGGIAEAIDAFAEATASGADLAGLAEADLGVVGALLAAAGSPVFSLCMNPIASTLQSIPSLGAAVYRDPEANLMGWRLLQAWLDAPKVAPVEVILAELSQRDLITLELLGSAS